MAAALGPSVDDLPLSSKVLPKKSPKNPGVATLQPFIPDPLPQRNRRNKRTNPTFLGSEFEVLPGLFEPTSYSRYLTMKFDNQKLKTRICLRFVEKFQLSVEGNQKCRFRMMEVYLLKLHHQRRVRSYNLWK